ncbi:dihydroorotase [Buchnera aphidicola str. APS (Acyrthosiphon pisum)]|uniref:Dihydroorotase n=1 Tax=Buchnera aphidicola subsp. Acyrthosiphon pisum (strain APS) TaxID=107806 RepID=PYRC_BUCAI|nr:dihydroorotase [Buchnera aphidicola]P57416.1 RecName: Full=Dihydroorotase; Short=DHOase [Buchnera aphidicola str. APS (Acyrthosiphon pisum)]pir/G84968/ dihydroorotase (EC 3.5.2.3) [imported] - Buchnera sp. (strain APS) [Buchnera sp. (in: enterobacteria)]BAB13039.1 dihydroorotase [Buchnera aphidicola str. APS (Acyrthosiphon pisum)]
MSKFVKKIKIIKPDDWHVHLRDNEILNQVIKYTGKFYKRAVIMPNLNSPITSCLKSIAYRNRILKSMHLNYKFKPLMTCYLTNSTSPKELEFGFSKKIFVAAKFYPNGCTTNSKTGIKKISDITPVLECMEKIGMPLLIHGEEINQNIDIYDREAKFIEKTLDPLRKKFPKLKIVLEHITTKESVEYIKNNDVNYLSATITPHHLMLNRNDMFYGGIQPYLYCLPILKKNKHRMALRKAISNGDKHFFLGSDTAPHLHKNKINMLGCAGIFNAPSSLLSYVKVFEEMRALKYLQSFCSENGPKFYNMPINKETITIIKKPCKIIKKINVGRNVIIPFLSGEILNWSIESD